MGAVSCRGPCECDDAAQFCATSQGLLAYNYETAMELQQLGEYAASLVLTERVVNTDPDYRDVFFLRGFGFQMTDRQAEAVVSYRRHLQRHPEHAQSWFNMAHAQMTMGDCRTAIEGFERTLELRPEYVEAHQHLATCYEAIGESDRARWHREQVPQPVEERPQSGR